jgi:hypothetical protein
MCGILFFVSVTKYTSSCRAAQENTVTSIQGMAERLLNPIPLVLPLAGYLVIIESE